MKDSVHRSRNEGTPWQLGEIIEKHGREEWIDPLLDQLGPYLQLQIYDIANLLEIMEKLVYTSQAYITLIARI